MTNEKTYLINEIKEDLRIKIDLLEAIKNGYKIAAFPKELSQTLDDVIDDLILYSRLQITNILKA